MKTEPVFNRKLALYQRKKYFETIPAKTLTCLKRNFSPVSCNFVFEAFIVFVYMIQKMFLIQAGEGI